MDINDQAREAHQRMRTDINDRRTDYEVEELIPCLLQQHQVLSRPQKGLSYNDVAARLDIHFVQASRVIKRMLSDPESPVWMRLEDVEGHPRKQPRYYFALRRKQLDASPGRRRQIIRAAILDYLAAPRKAGARTKIAVKKAVTEVFVQMKQTDVGQALEEMISAGEVDVTPGPHASQILSLW